MGTINYRTSEYITIGIKPLYPVDFADDADFMEWAHEQAESRNMDEDEVLSKFINDMVDDQYNQVKWALENYRFYYFKVEIEPGYYEGFSVQISRETPLYMEPWEKDAAYGEIKELEKFLMECVKDFGLVECYPGWCMGYENSEKSISDITAAMDRVRNDIKEVPIWEETE